MPWEAWGTSFIYKGDDLLFKDGFNQITNIINVYEVLRDNQHHMAGPPLINTPILVFNSFLFVVWRVTTHTPHILLPFITKGGVLNYQV